MTDACKIAEMVRIQLKSQSNNLKGINIYPAGYKNMNYTLKKYKKKNYGKCKSSKKSCRQNVLDSAFIKDCLLFS